MFKFKKSLLSFAGLLALVILSAPAQAQGQKGGPPETVPPPQNVKVINTPEEPVPVTGTVSVSNLGTDPLPVRDVDKQNREPFSHTLTSLADLGSALGMESNSSFYTVPAGKRLVIEDVSAQVLLPVGQRGHVTLEVQNPAPDGTFRTFRPLTLTFQLTSILGIPANDVYVAGEPVRMTLRPGERLRLFFQRSATSGSAVAQAYIQGYLVDVPAVP